MYRPGVSVRAANGLATGSAAAVSAMVAVLTKGASNVPENSQLPRVRWLGRGRTAPGRQRLSRGASPGPGLYVGIARRQKGRQGQACPVGRLGEEGGGAENRVRRQEHDEHLSPRRKQGARDRVRVHPRKGRVGESQGDRLRRERRSEEGRDGAS